MNPNWTEYFAARMELLFQHIGARVYSNVDPARDYAGAPTVEVQEDAPTFRDYISGKSDVNRFFIVACRAPSAVEALEMARSVRGVIYSVIKVWEDDAVISNAAFDALAVEPDERGLVTGESFYAYVKFHFTEKIGLPQGE